MGYVVSALSNYTEQNAEKIIFEQLFKDSPVLEKIKANANFMTGVKSAETINIVSTRGIFQSQACALNPSGTTTYSQRTVTVGKPKIDMSWCERDLETKFTQKKMVKGGNYDALTYGKEILEDTMQNAAQDNAVAIWKGDTTSTDQFLLHYNGLIKILNADIPAGNTYSGTTWGVNGANSRTVVDGLIAKIIADKDVYRNGQPTIELYMNPLMAYQYRKTLAAANLFHLDATDPNKPLYAENTNIKIIEDAGLTGLEYIYAIEPENFHGATDMENEEEKYDVWFSKDDQKIYFHTEWKFGINVAFPSRCFNYLGV